MNGNFQAWALCLIRLMLGVVFIAHGSQKVLGLFGGPGLTNFVAWAATVGIPAWLGYWAALFELAGGLLLFCGIASELGAVMIMCVMMGAIWFVHGSHGFFLQNNGFEYVLVLLLMALAIIIGGAGACTLWDPFKSWLR